MKLKLFIIRHAQAMEKSFGQSDAQRELNSTGYAQAASVGAILKDKKISPDIVITSTADRALATSNSIVDKLDKPAEILIQKSSLYEASVRNILEVVNILQSNWEVVIIVGHNPSLHYFVEYITGEPLDNLSPAGIVELVFDLDGWEFISEKTGHIEQVFNPPYD